ncbi:MAG: RsmE family RNA methyltransferase [Desulfovibrionaceae bacterium]
MGKARHNIFLSSQDTNILIKERIYLLKGAEYKHVAVVLKVSLGEHIDVLSGDGIIASTIVTSINKKELTLSLLSYSVEERPLYTIILALAMPKNVRKTWILEKSVELKTSEILFWKGDHSQTFSQKKENIQHILQQAAKQCRNPYLPSISFANSITEVLQYSNTINAIPFFFYEKSEKSMKIPFTQYKNSADPIVLIIGPEGGFSQDEVDILVKNNIPSYSLGTSILRYETAAFLALSLLYSINEDIVE